MNTNFWILGGQKSMACSWSLAPQRQHDSDINLSGLCLCNRTWLGCVVFPLWCNASIACYLMILEAIVTALLAFLAILWPFPKDLKLLMGFCGACSSATCWHLRSASRNLCDFYYDCHPTWGGTHWHSAPCGSAPYSTLRFALLRVIRIHRMWITFRLIAHKKKIFFPRSK